VSVSLRRARADDVDFLVELVTGEDTRRFLGNRVADTREAVLAELARPPDEHGWFVIESDGERAGCVAFERASEQHRIAHAGRFVVHPDFRARRIGVEAAKQFQRLLLGELGFHRIELQIYAFNERAIAHAERAGYVREGVKRRAYRKDGEWVDAVMYALTQEDLADE
jgi:RimJ/RimL family protein N-acetyltransferase